MVTVDLNEELVAHGDELAATMGWSLRNVAMDMRDLATSELGSFHHVTSVCVFEHIPLSTRIEIGHGLGVADVAVVAAVTPRPVGDERTVDIDLDAELAERGLPVELGHRTTRVAAESAGRRRHGRLETEPHRAPRPP